MRIPKAKIDYASLKGLALDTVLAQGTSAEFTDPITMVSGSVELDDGTTEYIDWLEEEYEKAKTDKSIQRQPDRN